MSYLVYRNTPPTYFTQACLCQIAVVRKPAFGGVCEELPARLRVFRDIKGDRYGTNICN